jgi:hypothetical protein
MPLRRLLPLAASALVATAAERQQAPNLLTGYWASVCAV